MKKILLLFVIICLSSFSGFSQREVKDGLVIDKQAQKIISDIS